jgi:imidazolonepropionase-like amidohydrolase
VLIHKKKMTGSGVIASAIVIVIGLVAPLTAAAQHDPRVEPAPTYVIQGATIHTLAGAPIDIGSVVLSDGVIVEVGANITVPAGATVIDAAGLHVYPGMVDAFSRLGLTEVGSVAATSDVSDLGSWNPHLRAYDAIHPASAHIPVARANGVTYALTAPGGGGGFRGGGGAGIPGQAALIHLDGYTVEEMAINPSFGMMINWPTIQTRSFDFSTFTVTTRPYTEAKREYDERLQELESWFEAAQHYKQAVENGDPAKFDRDLQLEHLARTLGGELPVIVSANDKRGIESAVEFAERYDLRVILARARDARKVKELLAEKGIPVILGPTQTLPANEDDPYHYPASLAGELYEAGVKICFGTFNSADSRTLPFRRNTRGRRPPGHDRARQAGEPDGHRRRPARDPDAGRVRVHQRDAGGHEQQAPAPVRVLQCPAAAGDAHGHGAEERRVVDNSLRRSRYRLRGL